MRDITPMGLVRARRLAPRIESRHVASALKAAQRNLTQSEAEKLREWLDGAFQEYFSRRIDQLWAAKAPASKTAKALDQMARSASKLIRLLGADRGWDSVPFVYQACLANQANFYAERMGDFAEYPSVTSRTTGRKEYRGKERVSACFRDLILLRDLLKQACAYERGKVASGKRAERSGEAKRRTGDEAMPDLFNRLAAIWCNTFSEKPRTRVSAHADSAAGPYVEFLAALFMEARKSLPAGLVAEFPKLKAGLNLTKDAARARHRRTTSPKVRNKSAGLVKSAQKKD